MYEDTFDVRYERVRSLGLEAFVVKGLMRNQRYWREVFDAELGFLLGSNFNKFDTITFDARDAENTNLKENVGVVYVTGTLSKTMHKVPLFIIEITPYGKCEIIFYWNGHKKFRLRLPKINPVSIEPVVLELKNKIIEVLGLHQVTSTVITKEGTNMRTLTAKEAGHYVGRLSRIATVLEKNWEDLGLTQKQALDYAFEVDSICEEIETTSKAAALKSAKLLQGDPADPEAYMAEHFLGGRKEGDADESYMSTFDYKPGGVHPTRGSGGVVSERTESPIQDLSDYSDGFKKQPSQPFVGGSPYPEKTASVKSGSLVQNGRYVRQVNR